MPDVQPQRNRDTDLTRHSALYTGVWMSQHSASGVEVPSWTSEISLASGLSYGAPIQQVYIDENLCRVFDIEPRNPFDPCAMSEALSAYSQPAEDRLRRVFSDESIQQTTHEREALDNRYGHEWVMRRVWRAVVIALWLVAIALAVGSVV